MAASKLRDILRRRSAIEWIIFFALLTVCAVAGHFLSRSVLWIDLRSEIYQHITSFGRPTRYPQRTAVVLLNDDDYWSEAAIPPDSAIPRSEQLLQPNAPLDGRVPTNRVYLAHLIDQLDAANVGLIGLDFDLRSPRAGIADFKQYLPETDALVAAIKRACSHGHQVVLASELISTDGGLTEAANAYDGANLPESCVHTGYIQLPNDMRRVPIPISLGDGKQWKPFALSAVDAVDHAAYLYVTGEKETDFPYSQFISEAAFRQAYAPQALFFGHDILFADPAKLAPKLLNRIVLVGADWHTLAFNQGPIVDPHPSPNGALAGVLLQANYIEAALQNGTVKPFPELFGEALDVVLVLLLSLFGMVEIHWAWKWSVVAVSSIFVLVFSYFFLQTFGLFLDFFFPLIFVGLHSGYEHVLEWRHEGKHHRASEDTL